MIDFGFFTNFNLGHQRDLPLSLLRVFLASSLTSQDSSISRRMIDNHPSSRFTSSSPKALTAAKRILELVFSVCLISRSCTDSFCSFGIPRCLQRNMFTCLYTALFNKVQYSTTQYYTIQYNTIQLDLVQGKIQCI